MPTTCEWCKEKYNVSKDEVNLLSCQKCGQGIHHECLVQILGGKYDSNMSQEDVMSVLNPMGFLGFYYLCGECSGGMMPADEEIKSRVTKPKVRNDASAHEDDGNKSDADDVDDDDDEDSDEDDDDHTHRVVIHDENGNLIESKPLSKKSGFGFSDAGADNWNKPPICKYYKNGNCKHGRKGDGCNFDHPKACRKLMQHGNKGQRGCKDGRNCIDFHPRMCADSITKGECFNNKCTFVHVKGTKRKKKVHEGPKKKKLESNNSNVGKEVPVNNGSNMSKDFLDLVHNFKRDIMEMDTKLNMVMMSLGPQKMNFQTMPMFSVRPTETSATMTMPWMGMQQSQQTKM